MAGLILLSFNLRPAAVSVGPVLEEVRRGLGLTGAEAGLLTSLPVLAFAIFGALAPSLARVVGLHRALALSLVAVVIGLGGRASAHDSTVFLGFSAVALAGMATANVLIPSLVKLHFPDRIGRATAIYTTALAVGLTSAFLLTGPDLRRLRQLAGRTGRLGPSRARRPGAVAGPARARQAPGDRREEHLVRRRGAYPDRLGHGALLRPAVAAGVLDLRLVRPAVARLRLHRGAGRAAGRDRGRRQHPAVALAALGGRPSRRPARPDPRGPRAATSSATPCC